MNTTKLVVMTLPNYYEKEFAIHWKFFPTFHNPSVHQNPFFSPFKQSSEVITHYTEWSQTHSTIQHPNLYSSTITQHNQRNIPVIMHPNNVFILQHLKMIPIFIWLCSTKIPFMLLCHIGISQTWYLSRANHMLHHKSSKYHTKIIFKPLLFTHTCTQTSLNKKNPIFSLFIFNPMVAHVKIHKCLILMYAHHLPQMSF